jgi:hypothetical protein
MHGKNMFKTLSSMAREAKQAAFLVPLIGSPMLGNLIMSPYAPKWAVILYDGTYGLAAAVVFLSVVVSWANPLGMGPNRGDWLRKSVLPFVGLGAVFLFISVLIRASAR